MTEKNPLSPKENDLTSFINEVLGTDYKHLDDIPDDKLRRAVLLLQIELLLREHPEIKVFICKRVGEPTIID